MSSPLNHIQDMASTNLLQEQGLPVQRTTTHPFNDDAADIILRSSDRVDFYVYKAILFQASPFFHGMFTLPQDQGQAKSIEHPNANRKSVIEMVESSNTLELLLTLCYPLPTPSPTVSGDTSTIEQIARVRDALEIHRKFEIIRAREFATATMLTLATSDPMLVYILASRYGHHDIARRAAKASLRKPFDSLLADQSELHNLSGRTYWSLLSYHKACMNAALSLVRSLPTVMATWRHPTYFWYSGGPHGYHSPKYGVQCPVDPYVYPKDGTVFWRQSWWSDYLEGIESRMATTPHDADLLTTENIYTRYLMDSSIKKCKICCNVAAKDISDFVVRFYEELSRVQLEIILDLSHIV